MGLNQRVFKLHELRFLRFNTVLEFTCEGVQVIELVFLDCELLFIFGDLFF